MSNSADMPPTTETSQSSAAQSSTADPFLSAQQADQAQQSKLSPEDLARVEQYLSSPIHSVERKPFKAWVMMLALVAVVVVLGFLSQLIAWLVL